MTQWTWNEEKDRLNRIKHGLALADGVPVLHGILLA